ncbi:hypothetical protein EFO53_13070 [Lacticaseibacillus rhamnosus]|uniref:Alpha-galactosidase n=1 Tax=Lacticaseibacillus rhamnosus TaxID=47715 RepID=A0AB74IGD4_LACRH|nr:hypothetical protein N577_011710 [Lacticaseibacillus rhamnosus 2166]KDS83229.1 hypothetical protein LR51B_00020 [Lacticaseibacillus rhamnosus 51B]MCT3148807.1 hypothetical protein [Lacticaseibacillus rhamnosus]MCT3151766.1 hypothetical protein [Lacticaseibacillus rhamnosus]MCT3155521.1 hypothetical protein [Lacticaseibacillus rhamnosus]
MDGRIPIRVVFLCFGSVRLALASRRLAPHLTRSPAQNPACKDLRRNGQSVTSTAKDGLILRK